jgi:hypothetical protein
MLQAPSELAAVWRVVTLGQRREAPAVFPQTSARRAPAGLAADRRTEDGLAAARPIRFAARDVDRREAREERLARDQAAWRSAIGRRPAVLRGGDARSGGAHQPLARTVLARLTALPARRGREALRASCGLATAAAVLRPARGRRRGGVAPVDEAARIAAGVPVPIEHERARGQGRHACRQAGDGRPVDMMEDAVHQRCSIAASTRRARVRRRLFTRFARRATNVRELRAALLTGRS